MIGDYDEDLKRAEIEAELAEIPYAYFCGFGYYYPEHRRKISFFLPAGAMRSEVLDENGSFTPYVLEISAWIVFSLGYG